MSSLERKARLNLNRILGDQHNGESKNQESKPTKISDSSPPALTFLGEMDNVLFEGITNHIPFFYYELVAAAFNSSMAGVESLLVKFRLVEALQILDTMDEDDTLEDERKTKIITTSRQLFDELEGDDTPSNCRWQVYAGLWYLRFSEIEDNEDTKRFIRLWLDCVGRYSKSSDATQASLAELIGLVVGWRPKTENPPIAQYWLFYACCQYAVNSLQTLKLECERLSMSQVTSYLTMLTSTVISLNIKEQEERRHYKEVVDLLRLVQSQVITPEIAWLEHHLLCHVSIKYPKDLIRERERFEYTVSTQQGPYWLLLKPSNKLSETRLPELEEQPLCVLLQYSFFASGCTLFETLKQIYENVRHFVKVHTEPRPRELCAISVANRAGMSFVSSFVGSAIDTFSDPDELRIIIEHLHWLKDNKETPLVNELVRVYNPKPKTSEEFETPDFDNYVDLLETVIKRL